MMAVNGLKLIRGKCAASINTKTVLRNQSIFKPNFYVSQRRSYASNNIDFSFFDTKEDKKAPLDKTVLFTNYSLNREAKKAKKLGEAETIEESPEIERFLSNEEENEFMESVEDKYEGNLKKPYTAYKKKTTIDFLEAKGEDYYKRKEELDDLIASIDLNPTKESCGVLFKAVISFVEKGRKKLLPTQEQIRHLLYVLNYWEEFNQIIVLFNFLLSHNYREYSIYSEMIKNIRDGYVQFLELQKIEAENQSFNIKGKWKNMNSSTEKSDYFSWHNDFGLLFSGILTAVQKGVLKDISVVSFIVSKSIENVEIAPADVSVMLQAFSVLHNEVDFSQSHYNTWFKLLALDIINNYTQKKGSAPYLKKSELKNILIAMRKNNVELNIGNLRNMLYVFTDYSIPRLSMEAVDLMTERFEYVPEANIITNILRISIKPKKSARFDRYYANFKNRLQIQEKTFTAILHALLDNTCVPSAMNVFRDALQSGVNFALHMPVITKLFRGLCETDRFDEAISLFEELPSLNIPIDNNVATTLINFLIQAQLEDETQRVLDFIQSADVKPDVQLSNALVRFYMRRDQRDKVASLFDYMLSNHFYLNDRNWKDALAKGFISPQHNRLHPSNN